MSPRATGLLFLVAAALAAIVYFYEIQGEEARRAEAEAEKLLFAGISAEDVTAIALTSADGAAVRAQRTGPKGGWKLTLPLAFPGDEFALDAMASALAQITSESAIEDRQEASVYGLGADGREVRFEAGGAERILRLGDNAPVGPNVYVSVGGGPEVYLVANHRVNAFAKSVDDLREKRLLAFDTEAVDRIELGWPEGGVVLVRKDGVWELAHPLATLADAETVDNLLSDLSFLRATGFEDDPPADEESGLAAPGFTARISGAGSGEGEEPFEVALQIASRPDGDSRLARAGEASLYRIPDDRVRDLATDVVAYRQKQLADFDGLDGVRIDILFHTEDGESIAITAERGEAGWSSQPEAFAPGKLAALVEALAKLKADDIAAESMGPKELAGIGLAPAKVIFSVFGAPSGEPAGGQASQLAEIHLGVLRGTDGITAQRPGDEKVYMLDYALAEHLPVSYEAFGNHFRAEAPAEAPEAAAEVAAPAAAEPAAE